MSRDRTPAEKRLDVIHSDILPWVTKVFARHDMRSAVMSVAQFWADEADDAVHAGVDFSARETPPWPHRCMALDDELEVDPADREICSDCEDIGWPPFDDNGEAIPTFQACCREGASEGSPETYAPYAIFRKPEGEPVSVEIVGGPIRAWLDDPISVRRFRAHRERHLALLSLVHATPDDDAPRHVLADALLAENDPRGHYLALALAGESEEERRSLERRHGVEWLGPLATITSLEHVRFGRGFPSSLAVHIDTSHDPEEVELASEWATIEELTFLPQSLQRISPKMTALRSVGPLRESGLVSLREHAATLPSLEHVAIVLESARSALVAASAFAALPHLRRLTITSELGDVEPEDDASFAAPASIPAAVVAPLLTTPKRLDTIAIGTLGPRSIADWLRAPFCPEVITFSGLSPIGLPRGPSLRVLGVRGSTRAELSVPSFGGVGLEVVARSIRALPEAVPVTFRRTRWFSPRPSDLARLSRLANRSIGEATS